MQMVGEAFEAGGDLGVPLIPVVDARFCVELVGEMAVVKASGESTVGF
jgi:hypothetical protein